MTRKEKLMLRGLVLTWKAESLAIERSKDMCLDNIAGGMQRLSLGRHAQSLAHCAAQLEEAITIPRSVRRRDYWHQRRKDLT